MIEDHTHCIQCGRVCYYPDNPEQVIIANEMRLCWNCYKNYKPKKINKFETYRMECKDNGG